MVTPVRELIALEEDQLWNLPLKLMEVQFDDGVLKLTTEQVIINWYYWLLHRELPGTPILKTHAFTKGYNSSVHESLAEVLIWDIYWNHPEERRTPDLVWALSQVYYELGNALYNAYCVYLPAYMTSVSFIDVIEMLDHPELMEAKKRYRENAIEGGYEISTVEVELNNVTNVAKDIIFGRPNENPLNGLKLLGASKSISAHQTGQLIGIRGFTKDIDSGVFPLPVDVSYIEGLTTLYDSATESRSAATSKLLTEAPLETSEHYNRIMQLHCSATHSVVGKSCVDWKTVKWDVEEDQFLLLNGKYHMVDGVAKVIRKDNFAELVGTTIQMRDVMGCNNEDPQTCCHTCLGLISLVMPPHTNVGVALSSAYNKRISQRLLSNKHYEASSYSVYLEMDSSLSKWLRQDQEDRSVLRLERTSKNRIIMRVGWDSVPRIAQVNLTNVDELAPSRISNCKTVCFGEMGEDGTSWVVIPEELDVAVAGAGAHFSTELLRYLSVNEWTSDASFIYIDLSKWDKRQPLLNTPRRGDNVFLYLSEIKSFIVAAGEKGDNDRKTNITNYRTRSAALAELVSVVRSRDEFKNVNMCCISIYARACMVVDEQAGNYCLPRANDKFEFVNANRILQKRSLSCALAYNWQDKVLISPEWYIDKPRMPNMFDPFIVGD